MPDLTLTNATQPQLEYEALRLAYRNLLSGPEGELVRADISRMGRLQKTTFVVNDPDGRQSANLEGKRFLALYIIAMAEQTNDLLLRLHEKEPV